MPPCSIGVESAGAEDQHGAGCQMVDSEVEAYDGFNFIPEQLGKDIQNLIQKASEFNAKISAMNDDSVILKAFRISVDESLAEIADKTAQNIARSGTCDKTMSFALSSDIFVALRLLEKMESVISNPEFYRLESWVKKLYNEEKDLDDRIRLSPISKLSDLAFEFKYSSNGHINVDQDCLNLGRSFQDLKVHVEPIMFVRISDILDSDGLYIEPFKNCRVEAEQCSHKLFNFSSVSGIIGEGDVRVRISMESNSLDNGKTAHVWGPGHDVNKFQLVEARAIQENSFPSNIETKPDMFISSNAEVSGLSVTVKAKTFVTSKNEPPSLCIQLVLKPRCTQL